MKLRTGWMIALLSTLLVVAYACQDQPLEPDTSGQEQVTGPEQIESKPPSFAAVGQRNFRTHLKGENEVPAVETNAQGQAIFKVAKDGSSIHYKLIVSNIDDVVAAHIHNASAGKNGLIVVGLYPGSSPLIQGRFQGVLAEGTITADDLVGPLAGASLDALITEMKAGNTYVNVHTTDSPPGEIRGQIH